MTDRIDEPLDAVIAAFRQMPVPAPPDPALLFPRRGAARATSETSDAISSRGSWRLLLRATARYGAVAAMLLVAFVWLLASSSRSLALAEVIRATGLHELVRYEVHCNITVRPDMPKIETTGTVYVDLLRPRIRFEGHPEPDGEGLVSRLVVHDGRSGDTLDSIRVSRRLEGDDGRARSEVHPLVMVADRRPDGKGEVFSSSVRPGWKDILPVSELSDKLRFLDALRTLERRKGTTSVKDWLYGRQVIKFSAKEPNSTYIIWVDPQTKLPLRIEYQFRDAASGGQTTRLVCKNFEWDPKVADVESLFRTESPVGHADQGARDSIEEVLRSPPVR
jgi:hypothetical protein